MFRSISFHTAILLASLASAHAVPLTLSSPGKLHTVEISLISLDKEQSLHAKVLRDGKVIVKDLSFGLSLVGAEPLGKGFEIKNALPFTRMTTGPMDATPGGFRNVMPEDFKTDNTRPMVIGTRSRELAKFVIYESPLQMLCDAPAAYIGQPGADFLKLVPSTWDETSGLQGQIGEFCVLARRSGESWFLGAMTDEKPGPGP